MSKNLIVNNDDTITISGLTLDEIAAVARFIGAWSVSGTIGKVLKYFHRYGIEFKPMNGRP